MEYKDLRCFVEVVRQGGFSSAARECAVSQSAVSKAVKALETETGFVLLERGQRARSRLTGAGELVYERGLRMLAERQGLDAELDDLRGLRRGVLRLGLPRVGAGALFASALGTYRERYPGIEIQLLEHGSQPLLAAVRSGEVELAAILSEPAADLVGETVHSQPLVAVLPRSHPLAARRRVGFTDLADVPFLLLDPDFAVNRLVLDAVVSQGIRPRVLLTSVQAEFLIDLVAAGLGVTFLPGLIVAEHPRQDVVAVPLAERIEWHIQLVHRRGARLSHAAQAWLRVVREARS